MGGSHRDKSDSARPGPIYESKSLNRDFVHQSMNAFEASPTIKVRVEYDIRAKYDVNSLNRDDDHQWMEVIEVSPMVQVPALSVG